MATGMFVHEASVLLVILNAMRLIPHKKMQQGEGIYTYPKIANYPKLLFFPKLNFDINLAIEKIK